MSPRPCRAALLAAVSIGALSLSTGRALAQDTDAKLSTIEKQIQALQSELQHMKRDLAAKNAELRARAAPTPAPSAIPPIPPGYVLMRGPQPDSVVMAKVEPAVPPPPPLPPGTFKAGGVTVTLGGFIETTGIFRTRNEVADVGSNFNTGIPLPNSPLYYENEARFTSRQSRLSIEAQADPDPVSHLDAYFEFDFLGAAPTANSVESNSYNLRVRHLYSRYERSDLGLHVLAGQTWSLLTMYKTGLDGNNFNDNIPITIDAQYVPGFTWARQPQFRIVKDWDKTVWLGASLESPQGNFYSGPNGAVPSSTGSVNISNPGGSLFSSGTNYSDDIAPDLVAKAALDQPFGHFEVYGVGRLLNDRVTAFGAGSNKTVLAGGGGADALLHVVPKVIDIQGSFLAGDGIGRYGSAQLPDATVGVNGAPVPLPEVQALVGIVTHPVYNLDLYAYGGYEGVQRRAFSEGTKGYGYGSPLYSNADCQIQLGAGSGCVGNTSSVLQGTIGEWWKPIHSTQYGTVQIGLQYSYTKRSIFSGIGPTPKTDDNIIMLSIRLYPFLDTSRH